MMKVRHSEDLPDLPAEFKAFDEVKAVLQEIKDGVRPGPDHAAKAELSALAKQLRGQAVLVRVTPESDPRLLAQMQQDEKVHGAGVEEFMATRIAPEGTNKGSFALAAYDENGPRSLAAMYGLYDRVPVEPSGRVSRRVFRGDVDTVKALIPQALEDIGEPNIIYPYSVSSVVLGAGPVVASAMRQAHGDLLFCTISPIRDLTKKLDMRFFDMLDPATKESIALSHLAQGEDSVGSFHMGNGAYVLNVHFNPSKKDPIVINYFYSDGAELEFYRKLSRAGYGLMVQDLVPGLSEQLRSRVSPIRAPIVREEFSPSLPTLEYEV